MKINFLLAIMSGLIFFSTATMAQTNVNIFFAKFKTAVVKGDKNAVANLSSFPLEMPFGFKKIKSKADFIRRYNSIMNLEANSKRCFKSQKLEKSENSNRYFVSCTFKSEPESSDNRPILYYFTKTKFGWRFSGLDNINE